MALRIDRVSDGQLVILRLSGRLQAEHVGELRTQLEAGSETMILDLAEVKLVDRDVVCFLGECEAKGVQLNHCSPYIREWIDREKR
jgi:anti-anti-sigma regulatory factor